MALVLVLVLSQLKMFNLFCELINITADIRTTFTWHWCNIIRWATRHHAAVTGRDDTLLVIAGGLVTAVVPKLLAFLTQIFPVWLLLSYVSWSSQRTERVGQDIGQTLFTLLPSAFPGITTGPAMVTFLAEELTKHSPGRLQEWKVCQAV